MSEHTPEQISASERAMDGLEAQADIWADEIDLVLIVKNIGDASRKLSDRMPTDIREGFINRQEANIDALTRQAYLEGFMRGGDSRKEYDAAQITRLRSELDQARGMVERMATRINEVKETYEWCSEDPQDRGYSALDDAISSAVASTEGRADG